MQTTNKVTTIATLLKCHSGLLYLSLFFSCTVISDLPYDINMFLIDLFLLLFTQRTNSQSGLNKFCDDAFTLNEAVNQCPSNSGSPFPMQSGNRIMCVVRGLPWNGWCHV